MYPFTAPIYQIVLEDYMLHALTEAGLESYTLRVGHQLTRNVHKVNNINLVRNDSFPFRYLLLFTPIYYNLHTFIINYTKLLVVVHNNQ